MLYRSGSLGLIPPQPHAPRLSAPRRDEVKGRPSSRFWSKLRGNGAHTPDQDLESSKTSQKDSLRRHPLKINCYNVTSGACVCVPRAISAQRSAVSFRRASGNSFSFLPSRAPIRQGKSGCHSTGLLAAVSAVVPQPGRVRWPPPVRTQHTRAHRCGR